VLSCAKFARRYYNQFTDGIFIGGLGCIDASVAKPSSPTAATDSTAYIFYKFGDEDGSDSRDRTCRNETATARAFPQLSEDLNVDIAIIGGGIEGLQPRGCSIDQVAPP
jgi:hypothetical protein